MKIYITGFMGSGKSTFGKGLANILGYNFQDLDETITNKAGKSIADIFEQDGEEKFRALEHELLFETAELNNIVIACGGGTPCFNEQMQWMNNHGTTVYIKLFENELFNRLFEEDSPRPLLKGLNEAETHSFIYKNLRQRSYYYHQAQIVIDGLNITPEILAKELIKE
jgi:shikimate kinase